MKEGNSAGGTLLGGVLLVAGSCIGAGMLALPILTGLAGFFPSLAILLLSWAFMTFTGLLLIEANGWFRNEVNLISMAEQALGRTGKLIAWVSYLFLFYSLLVAYIAASGTIFSAIFSSLFSYDLPPSSASLFFTLFFGYIIYLGTRPVDLLNRILMGGLIVCYTGMIGLGLSRIDPSLLAYSAPSHVLLSLPVLTVSFGFQNMIPSLTCYMKGDLKQVRRAIWGGGVIALVIYFIWSSLVLGTIEPAQIESSYSRGEEATVPLRNILGSSAIADFAQGFAFFAVATSFLAQGLTLSHFLADGLKRAPNRKNRGWLSFLALTPPFLFALYNPQVFFRALSFAGGVCAMILFGFLPIAMVWAGRYIRKQSSEYRVSGGKKSLILAFLFALLVIGCEIGPLLRGIG